MGARNPRGIYGGHDYAAGVILGIPSRLGGKVLLFDQQPLVSLAPVFHAGERECAHEFMAVEGEFQVSTLHLLLKRFLAQQLVSAAIPYSYTAGPVVPFRDRAFKTAIVDGVVFDQNCQPLLPRIKRWPFGHGPRLQHPSGLEAQVIVQPPRMMPLDKEARRLRLCPLLLKRGLRRGLWRLLEGPFTTVFI